MTPKSIFNDLRGEEAEIQIRQKISELKMKAKFCEYMLESKHSIRTNPNLDSFSIYFDDKYSLFFLVHFIEKKDCFQFLIDDGKFYPSINTKINSFPLLDEAFEILLYCHMDFNKKIRNIIKDSKIDKVNVLRDKKLINKYYFLVDDTQSIVISEKSFNILVTKENKQKIITMLYNKTTNTFEIDSIQEVKEIDSSKYSIEPMR